MVYGKILVDGMRGIERTFKTIMHSYRSTDVCREKEREREEVRSFKKESKGRRNEWETCTREGTTLRTSLKKERRKEREAEKNTTKGMCLVHYEREIQEKR